MRDPAIRFDRVTKDYGRRRVLHDLELELPAGGVVALLGRNGAGKSTALRILLGFEEATRGRATVLGHDSAALRPEDRARIGYVAEGHPLPGDLRVDEYLRFDAAGRARFDERLLSAVLEHFDVDPGARIGSLSRGQRAGLSLGLAMAPDPELLVLDDPSLGLDLVARRRFLESIVHLAEAGGRTILLSTHVVEEVERLADRLLVLVDGRLLANCPADRFASMLRCVELPEDRVEEAADWPGLVSLRRQGETSLAVYVPGPKDPGAGLAQRPLSLEEALMDYLGDATTRPSFFQRVEEVA